MVAKALLLAVSTLAAGTASAEFSLQSLNTAHVPNELIIRFDDQLSQQEIKQTLEAQGMQAVKFFKSSNSVLAKTVPAAEGDFITAAVEINQSAGVQSVGLNRLFSINATADDPRQSRQYHHELIGSEAAWDVTTGSREVVVGVIDTGIIYNHPDLEANIWYNAGETGLDADGNDRSTNGIDDDGNGYVDDFRGWDFAEDDNDPLDDHGHGTHCAGSIGALGNNDLGVTGINWEVSLVPLRFITASGQGSEADAIEAIEYATMMGFDMTSNSWGGPAVEGESLDALYAAIEAAGKAGQLFIAASGNDGADNDVRPVYPASFDLENIISVAASDRRDGMAIFSNYGIDTVDLMAPGSSVYSTIKRKLFGREYGYMSGTSMAAPIVAGAAALIKSAYPSASASEIKERLLESVDAVSAGKGKLGTEGRLNLEKAIQP